MKAGLDPVKSGLDVKVKQLPDNQRQRIRSSNDLFLSKNRAYAISNKMQALLVTQASFIWWLKVDRLNFPFPNQEARAASLLC